MSLKETCPNLFAYENIGSKIVVGIEAIIYYLNF